MRMTLILKVGPSVHLSSYMKPTYAPYGLIKGARQILRCCKAPSCIGDVLMCCVLCLPRAHARQNSRSFGNVFTTVQERVRGHWRVQLATLS